MQYVESSVIPTYPGEKWNSGYCDVNCDTVVVVLYNTLLVLSTTFIFIGVYFNG